MKITRRGKVFTRMVKSYLSYKMGRPKPFICSYYTTLRCNLSCPYCPTNQDFKSKTDRYKSVGEMDTKQAKEAIRKIASLGVSIFSFSGGEPLLRDDIEELAKYAQGFGMSTILYTNGTLIDKSKAEKISNCFDTITISLPETQKNNNLRTKENIEKVERAFKSLKDEDVRVGASFVINNYSISHLEEITKRANQLADFILYIPIHYAPEYFPEKDQVADIEERILKLKRKYGSFISNSEDYIELFSKYLKRENYSTTCTAFDLYISLAPNGDLQGCSFPFSVGNVLNEDIDELLEKSKKSKRELKRKCSGGVLEGCGQLPLLFKQSIFKSFTSSLNIMRLLFKK